ncbi:hypothetical protein BMD20_12185 [Burkholderia multivorans]|nr:hypothetical protein BMD20_12185 [Burkholderia multivorans]
MPATAALFDEHQRFLTLLPCVLECDMAILWQTIVCLKYLVQHVAARTTAGETDLGRPLDLVRRMYHVIT